MNLELFDHEQITGKTLEETYPWMREKNFVRVKDIEQLSGLIDEAIKAGLCALDLESSGLDTRVYDGKSKDFIVGFSFSYDGVSGYYVPITHGSDNFERVFVRSTEQNLDPEEVKVHIQRLLDNCICIFHNCIFDHEMMTSHGYVIPEPKAGDGTSYKFHDTLILARLNDMGSKQIGLKFLSETFLQVRMLELSDLFEKGKGIRFHHLDPDEKRTIAYAASDAVCTYNLFKFYEKKFVLTDKRAKYIYDVERAVTFAVREMERNKCLIDMEKLREYKVTLDQFQKEIEEEANKEVGEIINLASPQQLGEVLVHKFHLKDLVSEIPEERGKIHTDSEYLEKHKKIRFVELILLHRDISKTLGTYVDNFLGGVDRNYEVKFQFIPTRTDTGRFASPGGKHEFGYSGVNIQALTAADDEAKADKTLSVIEKIKKFGAGFFLRSVVIARPGYKMVAIDYSGEELRVGANLSREPVWCKEFLEGEADLHQATAKLIFSPNPTKDERKKAKGVNFQIMYGGGPPAVAGATGLSREEAKVLIQKFFAGLKAIKSWMEREKQACKKRGYAETPFGRRRPLPGLASKDFIEISKAERLAINTPIQGAGGDIMKLAMIMTHRYIQGVKGEVRMLLTIHDELVFEVKEDNLDVHIPNLMNLMSLHEILSGPQYKWPVPLTMDCEVGDSWDVDYEYFERNPEMLEKLHPVLRKLKARALKVDVKPEPPKVDAPVQAVVVEEIKLEKPQPTDPISVAVAEFKALLPTTLDVEALERSFKAGLSKFIEMNPINKPTSDEYLNGTELLTERLKLPIAWKKYVYTLHSEMVTEEKAHILQFLLKSCSGGYNPFILRDHTGEILIQDRLIDAVAFEVLARHYSI